MGLEKKKSPVAGSAADLKRLDPAGALPRAGIPDGGFGIGGIPKWGHRPFPLCSVPNGPSELLAQEEGCSFLLAVLIVL